MDQLLLKYMKINKYKNKLVFLVIMAIATFLRLYQLSNVPPHLTPDEASLGYNAYSILKTAKDEYGTFMPIIFKSFGDFKPGLYIYLTVPSVFIFGLNEFSVRLPSAIFGVIAVWLMYLIVRILRKEFEIKNRNYELIAAFLLAINPWHLHFSRGAWEINVSLTLTLVGIYFFLKAFKKPIYLIFSSFFIASTLITYQGAKLSSLIVIITLTLVFWDKLLRLIKGSKLIVIVALVLGLVISSPSLMSFFRGETGRLGVYSVFSYPRKEEDIKRILSQGSEERGSVSYLLFHTESSNFVRVITGKWFNHFSSRFLFFEGDWPNPRHSAPNHGMLYLADFVFLIVGFFALTKTKGRGKWWVLSWLVLAPLPAVLTRDQVHAVRSYNLLIPLTILSSFGVFKVLETINYMKTSLFKVVGYLLFFLAVIGSLVYYFDAYYVHLSKHTSRLWSYGFKQIVEEITPIQDKYQRIKIQQSFAQPYIYFLFYQRYDPHKYQEQANLIESDFKGDVGYVEKIDNIYFWPINWPADRQEKSTIVVADEIRIPDEDFSKEENLTLLREIKYLDGNTAFKVVEVR